MTNGSGQWIQEVQEAKRRAQQLVSGLSMEQLAQRPALAKWSIAECLAHLNVTASVVQPLVRRGIERGKKEKLFGKGPFSPGPKGRFLVWLAEPPPKIRMSAPKSVAPPVSIPDPAKLLPDFLQVQDEWEQLMRDSDGLNLARIKLGPLLSPFRCRLSGGFPWMMAHQRRHLLQAESVKRQIAPAASASSSTA
jgi:hypothetical protein